MDLVERLLTLVKIESVIRHEEALCDFFAARAAAWSDYTLARVGRSLALRPRQRAHEHLICLAGHLDTVPPSAENPPRVEGGRVFGLGAADMKAGLSLMWGLLDDPVADPFYDLAFIFYDGEEGPYADNGLGPLLEASPWIAEETTLAICLEPTDNTLQLGCLGTINARVHFSGRSAHSARPWQGENAIHKAAPVLARLAAFAPREVRYGDEGELIFREVISATRAEGGRARNVVPDTFTLNLNYRYPPDKSEAEAVAFLSAITGADEGRADLDVFDLCPAGAIPTGNAGLERFRSVLKVPEHVKQAWTDVGRFSSQGIDAVNFGPAENAQCHQPDESTAILLLEEGDRLLRRYLSAS